MLSGFRIKPPKCLLLDVPTEEPRDKVFGEAWRRGRAKRRRRGIKMTKNSTIELTS
jgi:hypothetical protein